MSDFIVDFYQEQLRVDDPKTMSFHEKPFKPTRVFPGTVNIKHVKKISQFNSKH